MQEEDSKDTSWIHGYLHKVEGDRGNAKHWYRLAGKKWIEDLTLEEELEHIISFFQPPPHVRKRHDLGQRWRNYREREEGSTTKGILMKINLIFKLVVIILSVFLNTSDVFARQVEYFGEEILIYIVPGTLTQVTFPSKTRCKYGSHKGPVVYECQGNFILLIVQPELPIDGKLEYIRLRNGRIYKLKIIRADNNHATDDVVNILDRRADTDVKEKDTRPNK